MAIIVAEYLGKRTDSPKHIIPIKHYVSTDVGIQFKEKGICPFNELPCKKMDKKSNARFPVCSLRRNGDLYIVCEHRLVSSSRKPKSPLSLYQSNMLLTLAREIFHPDVKLEEIIFKTETSMSSGSRVDYLLGIVPSVIKTYGPNKLIVEMQGGGETSDTGNMTTRLIEWTLAPNPSNTQLTLPLEVGLIQANAWRRLQEQILTKGSVSTATGYGLVACVGTHLFDHAKEKVSGLDSLDITKYGEWDTALIAYCEDTSKSMTGNAVPLKIDHSRTIYTTYKKLAQALIERGEPDQKLFEGSWNTMTGEVVNSKGEPILENPVRKRKQTPPATAIQPPWLGE